MVPVWGVSCGVPEPPGMRGTPRLVWGVMDWRQIMNGARMHSVLAETAPMVVGDQMVSRVHMYDVPASLASHAHALLRAMCGPLTSRWWVMGEYTLEGDRLTLVARVAGNRVEYGTTTVLTPPLPDVVTASAVAGGSTAGVVACPECTDVRPHRDVTGQGAVPGEPCVFPDCGGLYV